MLNSFQLKQFMKYYRIERPIQLLASIPATQYRNPDTVAFQQRRIIGNLHRIERQTRLCKQLFRLFAQMATARCVQRPCRASLLMVHHFPSMLSYRSDG